MAPDSASAGATTPREGVWIVIAAFNEASAIGPVIAGVKEEYACVVIVDDGSADGTSDVARAHGADVLTHPFNLGQGAALQTGITYALRQGAAVVVTFDADGQHRPDDIAKLLDALSASDADIACGSRFLGSTGNMPLSRRLILKAAVLFTFLLTGVRMTDAHNGLRAMTRRCAQTIVIRQNRMAHASEIITEVVRAGLKLVEVPVHIEYTEYSEQKGQKLSGMFEIVLDLVTRRLMQ